MGSEGIGDCSHRNNVDNNIGDSEQPLKKARYVWQVKGNYNLKNMEKDTENDNEDKNLSENEDLSCNGRCYMEGLLTHSDNMMGYEDSSEDECQKNIDKSIQYEIPVTLVKPNPKNEDYYLQKWQARQVAKGYMDNTINRVIETCLGDPFGVSESIENCEDDGQVEDEGILMAIQSHGLHSNDDNWNRSSTKRENQEGSSSLFKPEDIEEFASDNYQNIHNELFKNKMTDESNFLEAAVSVAIQKKGLSSQNCV